jgi:hypothetical protein
MNIEYEDDLLELDYMTKRPKALYDYDYIKKNLRSKQQEQQNDNDIKSYFTDDALVACNKNEVLADKHAFSIYFKLDEYKKMFKSAKKMQLEH